MHIFAFLLFMRATGVVMGAALPIDNTNELIGARLREVHRRVDSRFSQYICSQSWFNNPDQNMVIPVRARIEY
jgi:hypothetical protein